MGRNHHNHPPTKHELYVNFWWCAADILIHKMIHFVICQLTQVIYHYLPSQHRALCKVHRCNLQIGTLSLLGKCHWFQSICWKIYLHFWYLVVISPNNSQYAPVAHPWWCHQMGTFSELLEVCAGNLLVTGEFPSQGPMMWSFDIFLGLCLNKGLSKQSWGWWFEMPSSSLWCHCNEITWIAMAETNIIIPHKSMNYMLISDDVPQIF